MALITLHLTGAFRITDPDGQLIGGISRRGQAMLAILAMQTGMRAERAMLADLLWSDRGAEQARASLRQELSVLRKALPADIVQSDRQAVWLDERHLSTVRGQGEFLQGFDLGSEGFEDWLRLQRATDQAPSSKTVSFPGRPERPSLAVLPFEAHASDDSEILAQGVVEEITGALSRVQVFHVIARQSACALPRTTMSAPEAAKALGADYLIEGSVRRSQDRVRINVQLIKGQDGRTVWAQRFDDHLDDFFDLQDRIATSVAGQLAPNLRAAEIARARQNPPEDRSAYELYLTALPHFWVHDAKENERAIALLDAALAINPSYGTALAQRSWCYAHQCCYHWTTEPEQARRAARQDFDKAMLLVIDHAPSLTALSATAALALKDFPLAEELARRAISIDPNNAWAWLRLGWVACYRNRSAEALEHFDRAEALSPLDPFLFNIEFGRSGSLRVLRDLDGALAHIEKGLRLAPQAVWAYRMLFGTLWLKGDKDAAIEAGRKWLEGLPGLSKEVLLEGLPAWNHDPEYLELLKRFDELIPMKK